MGMIKFTRFPELDYVSAEGFNTLITNLSYCGPDIRTIMLTSRYAGEGKSYVTMNLMRTYARMGKSVVVVDTDLRASGIQADYQLRSESGEVQGLSDYLSGQCRIEDALHETSLVNAFIIPAGHEAPNPLQLLDTEIMRDLMEKLSSSFDVVLVDTPPIGILVDAVALAKYCDGALLVVGYEHGKKKDITDAVERIKQTGCKVLGSVLNEVRFKKLSNRHYYYSSKRYSSYYKKSYSRKDSAKK